MLALVTFIDGRRKVVETSTGVLSKGRGSSSMSEERSITKFSMANCRNLSYLRLICVMHLLYTTMMGIANLAEEVSKGQIWQTNCNFETFLSREKLPKES